MKFYLITSNPKVSTYAIDSGVDSIFVDIETLGKAERQKNLNLHLTSHTFTDIKNIRKAISEGSEIVVRLNPLNQNSESEFNIALLNGASRIMFPMIRSVNDFIAISKINSGRCPIVYLIETKEALQSIELWIKFVRGNDRVHFGLNDLSLSYNMKFLFTPLALGLLDYAASIMRQSKIQFGIGGISRIGQGLINPKLILSEHVRLGSSWVILSRSFHGGSSEDYDLFKKNDLKSEILKIKDSYKTASNLSTDILESNHQKLKNECMKYS
jgi:hypothetical protein